jgi:hypothetical protein
MTDTRKYIENKTQKELLEIQKASVIGGDIHRAVTIEIQRIQQDVNNIQIAKLIGEVQKLKDITSENSISSKRFANWSLGIAIVSILISLFIGGVQIYLAKIQVEPILTQKYRAERSLYEFCREPGNWDIDEGGATPGSTCKDSYLKLKEKFGAYPSAESVNKQNQ